jgi:hypothetical protein
VSNNSVATCGSSCNSPCPSPLANGSASCNGVSCAVVCDGGPDGGLHYHQCGSADHPTCVDNSSVDNCGTSCNPCNTSVPHATPICNGTTCGFACEVGWHHCGSGCVKDDDADFCGAGCVQCAVDELCLGGVCGPPPDASVP